MKITDIKTYVLVADNADVSLTSSAHDTVLVIVETDEGITGYGETETSQIVILQNRPSASFLLFRCSSSLYQTEPNQTVFP